MATYYGTQCTPYLCLGGDYDTGLYSSNGKDIKFALDGIEVDAHTFIDGLVAKRRLDPIMALVVRAMYNEVVRRVNDPREEGL